MDERASDAAWLMAEYAQGRSLEQIAAELGCSRGFITKHMRAAGAELRPRGWRTAMKGKRKSPETRARMAVARATFWATIRATNPNRGATRLKMSHAKTGGHPKPRDGYYFMPDVDRPRGHIRIHRYVMAQALGRRLLADETVHHRDGDRSNNALSNLELWSHGQPCGQRVREKLAWAREIIRRYENLPPEIE